MKIKILTLIILLLTLLSLITISITECKKITSGIFAGRTVCYFGKVTINPGTTIVTDVNIIKNEFVDEEIEDD